MALTWVLWLLTLGRPALAADLSEYALPMVSYLFPATQHWFGCANRTAH